MTYFTVEAFVAGEGTSTAIYTLQSPVTPDPLSAEKKAALEELKNSYEDYRDTAEITEIQIEQLDVIYKQGRINIIDAATGAMITAKKNGAMQEMAAVLIDGETGLYVAVTVEAFTAIQGLIVKPTLVQISGETTVFKAIQRALASTYPDVALDELTIGSSYIAAVYLPGYTGTTNGENYLGQKDVGTDSGWVYCVDCVVPNVGVGVKKVSGGETVRLQYTVGGYGADVQPASDKDDLIMAMAQLRKIYSDEQLEGTATENKLTDEQLEAYSDAYALVNRLFADASDIDAADTALRAAFEEVFAPVDPAVKNVIDLIKAIGEVTLDSEDAIYAALDAYDKLTDAQKAKVRNYQTLVEAKDRYEELLNISSHDPDDALSGVLDYLAANVTDPVVNSQNGEWAVLAMARGGVLPDETREAYLSNLDAALDGSSITLWTEYERITLALSSMGIDASAYGETNLTENFKDYLAPAERPSVNQTLMVDIYALLALNAKPYASDSRDDYISRILAAEKDDGGWNHDETSDTADVDTSAMAIQALAPYYGENEGVTDAVGRALSWLKTKQDPYTGGYGEAGVVNTESTAQVVTALCALGIDPSGEEWTLTADGEELTPLSALTVWYDEAKGRFGHNSTGFDQMATEQAAYALVAWKRFSEDDYSLYDMQDMFPSNDTSVISLTVKELEAVPGENGTFTVELPGGTDLTTLTAADFTITAAAGATWTAPASEDNGVTWTFKVTAEDGTTKKDYTVTVTVAEVPVTDITLDLSEASVVEGETVTLTATVSPDNATDPTVTWTSSNEDVATVVDGVVTGVKAGTATITAKAGEKTATCEVTVTAAEVPVTDIALNLSEASVVEGATVTLTATVSPDNATDPTVTWSSSNEEVATVVDGVVTGVKAGTATITAKAGEKTATCAVTVTAAEVPVTDITLNQSEASVVEGAAVTLTATVSPDNATDPAVTWSSSNEEIATVVDGVVTGVKAGTATITAKAGEKTATCAVTVTAAEVPVTGITLDKNEASVVEGATVTLTATVSPENATDPTVTWSSSNEEVATVVDGVVTGVKAGTATITAQAGEKTATCKVTVTAAEVPVTDITLNQNEASVVEGETVTLTATVLPENATNPAVTWSSSDESVATVVDGVVTGVKAGTATITAKAGEKTATCEVTVTAAEVPEEDIEIVGGSEDEPVAEVSSSIETSVNDDGEETKTATLTVVSEKTNSAGEVVDNPCVVIVKNPDGSYEKLEAEENPDGGYDYVKEDYTEAMEFIVAVEGDYTGDGEFKTIDLAKANLDIIAKKDMDPVKVLIMGSANGKLRTIDLAKLNLILVNEDQN